MTSDNEPPSCVGWSIFRIGQDSRGNWVAQDEAGTRGGLFVDRAEALRYIRSESGPMASVRSVGCLELDASAVAVAHELGLATTNQRRIA